ncbi:hypothetical protein STEG23_029579, partial [Scotinomys teguina]
VSLEVPPPLMFPMTVTPLGRDQDCSLRSESRMCRPLGSWILKVGARPPRLACTSSSLESVPCPLILLSLPPTTFTVLGLHVTCADLGLHIGFGDLNLGPYTGAVDQSGNLNSASKLSDNQILYFERYQTRVISLGSKYLYQLSHPANAISFDFYNGKKCQLAASGDTVGLHAFSEKGFSTSRS